MSYKTSTQGKELIAMVHLRALPGTPNNILCPDKIIEKAVQEAEVYRKHGIEAVMIENMHDVPYIKHVGPEIVSIMAVIGREIKKSGLMCGLQVLAGANKEALAIAHAANLDFIRAEGYVFMHIGDEGMHEACAGELLRYRRQIGAENVKIYADIKKKHSSHAITSDVSIRETAETAKFFQADGVIVTGAATGEEPDIKDILEVRGITKTMVGSGITADNLEKYIGYADSFIVGSYFKKDGKWQNELDEGRIEALVRRFYRG